MQEAIEISQMLQDEYISALNFSLMFSDGWKGWILHGDTLLQQKYETSSVYNISCFLYLSYGTDVML